ncbi:MAG: S9 family peptidase [Bacteroidota bacterium]
MKAPRAKKNPSSRSFFGITLHDDYAWLRDKESPETRAYLDAENDFTKASTAHMEEFREKLYAEMLGRIKEDDNSVPYRKGGYFYYTRTEEGKAYAIHCRKENNLDAPEEIILDENQLAEGHEFFDLGDLEISADEQTMAYTVDFDGSEKYSLVVKRLDTGEILDESVHKIYGEIEWANDNKTLFYVRLDEKTQRPFKLFRHEVGQTGEDPLVFHEEDEGYFLSMSKTKDDRYLLIDLNSNITTEMHYLDADAPTSAPQLFAPRRKGIEFGMVHHEGYWYIFTNEEATNFRLMRTRVNAPGRENWEEVIAHDPAGKIDYVSAFRDHLVVYGRRNGLKNIQVRHLRSGEVHDLELPEPVYTVSGGANLEFDTTNLRFVYASLTTPSSVFDYDMDSRERERRKQQEVLGGYEASDYVAERIFATAEDGTRIPISLVYKKSLRKAGPQPFFLYAYGSYGHSIEPYFSSSRLSLLNRGMIFGIAHVRGGGEMGRPWYDNGKLEHKRNTFTDFIACAEHVIDQGYTAADQLGISGGSAGGMLMGGLLNMRPDLFQVVQAHVPFVDVMNTMLDPSIPLTVIEYDEWGNPNEEKFFKIMHSYSPYDNVAAQDYPDTLITAGLNDPRVHYWEPAKWCAKLRDLKTDDNILLLKTNMGAGHQGASGRYGHLKELAFDYAFMLDRLGLIEQA